ncbi:hypothetical protein JCM6882_003680 [Rhodosporidiobolus microsporus]
MKRSGGGSSNWGSTHDDILEGIELARSEDFVSHPAQNDASNHKLSISPQPSPSMGDKDKELEPSASA